MTADGHNMTQQQRSTGLFRVLFTIGCRGDWRYGVWMFCLGGLVLWGLGGYRLQLQQGLAVTGLSDQSPWGLYIANFLFLVGIAASAVILVAAVQLFHRQDLIPTLLPAKALAITAVLMSLLFVFCDLGHPERIWHALPLLGSLNFPTSILAWDILALTAYLLLNLGLVFLPPRKQSSPPNPQGIGMGSIVAIVLGLSIHTITAFMLAGNPSRPLWFSPLLAPRFIVSAFAAGSALMILLFGIVNRTSSLSLPASATRFLSQVLSAALLIHMFLLGVEFFTHFYPTDEHALASRLLYLGWNQNNPWTLWIYVALSLSFLATVLMIHPRWRSSPKIQTLACLLTLSGLWMEKGLGLVIPGLVPTPLGESAPYVPTLTEIQISLAIWALGAMILTWILRFIILIHPSQPNGLRNA
ncbi:MAG: molybdopterin oxidoreductase, rane subunit [Magnetococcales bacterium]|nr:molybdopterin oxidoreductase, rane subunit [Magnetococcales bacterium]HIJ85008.1 polysulfide reductase NrfD [Magnetococcales bacterium]